MKRLLYTVSGLLLLWVTTTSFNGNNVEHFLKQQGYVPVAPRGTKSAVYISATEISNAQYKYFLNDLKKKGRTAELAIAQVDTAAWKQVFNESDAYVDYYFQHEAYQNYPVVNISFEGAEMFCQWLTETYKAEGYSVNVRLPDSIEWKMAANGGNMNQIYSWEAPDVMNKKGFYLGNFKKTIDCDFVTAPVNGFKPNISGAYNMSGNVAEMLNIKGVHKGGSWNTNEEFIKINGPDPYAGIASPSPFIGFRPVVEIIQ